MKNIRIVLVETSHPGNIGGCARAMKNMGLSQLALVNPLDFPSHEATARASGADDVLSTVVVYSSLSSALADCHWVFGCTARLRAISTPVIDARDCGKTIADKLSSDENIAVVFGRENSGLSNEELDLCHQLVHIPGNKAYQSLNLAAAVQVLSYEIFMALEEQSVTQLPARQAVESVTNHELENFFQHLEQVLVAIRFLDPKKPKKLMQRLRAFYHRAEPDKTELNILRGILTETAKSCR
jgi:tRNA (cytidine32/uridine32-2'-O)-methyltransferase